MQLQLELSNLFSIIFSMTSSISISSSKISPLVLFKLVFADDSEFNKVLELLLEMHLHKLSSSSTF